ncbi:MAG: baseplate J/gp47 family protein [Kofleriaceae bacterium]|nr:baseplate J/gp47 family protein [Kofleriaceae bacterium]
MSAPWWTVDVAPRAPELDADPVQPALRQPRVFPADEATLAAEIAARRAGFTPRWTSRRVDDPGAVMIDLVAAQVARAARVIDELPVRARVEVLDAAGVAPLGPAPMRAIVALEVSRSATAVVGVGPGFRIAGTDVAGIQVIFETARAVTVTPGALVAAATAHRGVLTTLELPEIDRGAAILPFGTRPQLGDGFYLGLDTPLAPPTIALGLYVPVRTTAPDPVALGGLVPAPGAPQPLLRWQIHDGHGWVAAQLLRDESAALTRSGIVELAVGRRWGQARVVGDTPRRWLRALLVRGRWDDAPRLAGAVLNAVPVTSGETRRDEVLEPIEEPGRRPRRYALARGGVVPGSLRLEVDAGGTPTPWREVDELATAGPDDAVYVLDAAGGQVGFGDGVHGASVPDGFRHVRAVAYRVVSPSAAVAAGKIDTLVGSAAFVVGVANPRAASGPVAAEDELDTLRRGPRELRARRRAVTPADYEVCALRAGGVRRAHAVAGYHPGLPGRAIPGVVGVLVVGEPRDDGQPPVPDEQTLEGVAAYLVANAAPAGIEVVTAAARFHPVRIEARLVLAAGLDAGEALAAVARAADGYLDPLRGGDDGDGWRFGAAIEHAALVRRLLATEIGGRAVLRAIAHLNLVVDTVRSLGCQDRALGAHDLPWPETHELIPEEDT